MNRKNTKQFPEQSELHRLFEYNKQTGDLIWKERPLSDFIDQRYCNIWNGKCAGKSAGSNTHGYKQVSINGTSYLLHRLIWVYINGSIDSAFEIDHIDGNRSNSKIENLRLATTTQNLQNKAIRKNNTSGLTGVYKRGLKWVASIGINGKAKYVGTFETKEEAHSAYLKVASVDRGDFLHTSLKGAL